MRNTLVINLDRCSGCDSCVAACKYENTLPLGEYFCRVLSIGPTGKFPNVERYWLPVQCQQCENPQCVAVCPTGASYRDPDTNVVLVDHSKCIGCQYCIYACPFGVRSMDEAHGVGLGNYYQLHGPTDRFDLLTRHLNRVVEICRELGFRPIMWSDMFYRLGSRVNDY